jgi:hypothetical protein
MLYDYQNIYDELDNELDNMGYMPWKNLIA